MNPAAGVHHIRCPNHPQATEIAEALANNPPKEKAPVIGSASTGDIGAKPAARLRDLMESEMDPEEERQLRLEFERERAAELAGRGGLSSRQQFLINQVSN